MAQDNIDKGLYAAPQGMEELAEMEPDLEIEIEDRRSHNQSWWYGD